MFDMVLNKFVNAICLISFTGDLYQEDTSLVSDAIKFPNMSMFRYILGLRFLPQ
jgi:hypothetical protein